MQQPSAQGIASLFRGNPAPLQQRIQQEQQAKPGIPPDLQKLLALNIVTNEKDAVAKQQAMDQLAQMQGPQGQQGKPPTVMQTVQEQARQKMQAQQVQAQQQQEGLQDLIQRIQLPQVPENTPQPETQPQGIDELPVDFQMAGGGIVAFSGGGQSLNERASRQMEEKGSIYDPFFGLPEEERRRLKEAAKLKAVQDRARESAALVESNAAGLAATAQAKIADLEKNRESLIRQYGAKQYAQAVERAQREVGAAGARGSELMAQQSQNNQARVAEATPFGSNFAPANPADMMGSPAPQPAPKPVADLKALAEADARKKQQAPRPSRLSPVVEPAPEQASVTAPSAAIAPPQSEASRILNERMMQDPTVAAANKEMMYQSRVPAPDTTQRDAMIRQLQEERARQVGPQDSFGRLMEYLGQVAATPRGLSSFEAGSAGARGVRGLEEQRAQKRFDLGAKIIEQEQGKIETSRAYAKEVYGIGDKEYNQIYNAKLEAAKRLSTDEMDARKLAQQETLKMLELEQSAKIDRERMQNQVRVAGMQQLGERNEQARIDKITSLKQRARRATDPKVAAELMAQASDLEALVVRGGAASAAIPKAMTRDQASDNVAKKLEITNPNRKQVVADATQALRAAGIANPSFAQIEEHLIQEQMRGVSLSSSGTAPAQTGKVPPPPPGFKLN